MLTHTKIKYARFAPDQSDDNPAFSDAIMNVEPALDGWKPLKGFDVIGSGLGAQCLGAVTVFLPSGGTDIYAGTSSKLLKYNSGTASWDTLNTGFSVPSGYFWSFKQFGKYLVAVNGSDTNQYIDLTVASAFADLTGSPKARYVNSSGDFLVLLALVSNPNQLAWSGINNIFQWTYRENLSDYQPIPDGGAITGFVGYDTGGVVFLERHMEIMERNDRASVFSFRTVQENLGAFSPQSIVPFRNSFAWYDQSGFYMGPEGEPIGAEMVNDFVMNSADTEDLALMSGIYDQTSKIVWWLFTTSEGTYLRVGYDTVLKQWTQSNAQVNFQLLAVTPGYTYDSVSALDMTYDEANYTYDSSFWQGSSAVSLAGFNDDGDFGYFQTGSLEAVLETVDVEFNPGAAAFMGELRLRIDAPISDVTYKVGKKRFLGDTTVWTGNLTAHERSGKAKPRANANRHRVRSTIAANSLWNNAGYADAWMRASGALA